MKAGTLGLLLLCASCGCGCGATPPASVSRGGADGDEADADGAPSVVEMLWQGGPDLGFVARSAEGDGFVHRGLRLLLRDGRTEVADDVFAGNVVAASHEGDRWWFLASDGTLWRASSFLARPERAGRIGLRDFAPAGTSQEGLLIVHPAPIGDLYRVVGGVARRFDALPRGGVVGGAFLDARRGVALLHGGILAKTDDGGATWSPLTVRDEVVGVHAFGDAYRVLFREDSRRLRLAHDGTTEDLDVALARTDALPPLEALRAMADLELPASSYAIGALVTAPLAVAERLRTALADRDVFVLPSGRMPRTGAAVSSDRSAAFLGPRLQALLARAFEPLDWAETTGDCARRAWGGGAAVWCGERVDADAGAAPGVVSVLHRVDERGDSEQTDVVLPTGAFRLLDDGLGVAWAGGCERATAGEGDRTRFCWVPDVRTPRPITVTLPGRVATGAGDWLIVERRRATAGDDDDDDDHAPFWGVEENPPPPVERTLVRLIRGRDGRARAAPRPMPAMPAGHAIETAALTGDATLVVVALAREGGHRALLVGRPDAALERRTLPRGAQHVAFLDARRGIAVGRNAAELYRTRDGGRTWERLPLPIDGDAALLPLAGDEVWVRAFCAPSRCGVALTSQGARSGNAHISVRGWGALRASRESRVLVAETGPAAPPPQSPIAECAGRRWFGTLRADPTPSELPAPRDATRAFVANAWVDVATSGAASRRVARFRWSGHDATGAFTGAAGPFPVSRASAEDEDTEGSTRPLAASRHGVVFLDSIGLLSTLRQALIGDRVAGPLLRSPRPEEAPERVVSLPSEDGRWAFAAFEGRGTGAPIVEVVAVGVGDEPAQLRSFVLTERDVEQHLGIARDGGRAFLVVPIGGTPAAWRAYAMDRTELPRTYGRVDGPMPAPCRGPPAPGALVAVLDGRVVPIEGTSDRARGVELELSDAGVCIRAIHWRGRLAADASGHFVGDQMRGAASVPTTCTLSGASTDCVE